MSRVALVPCTSKRAHATAMESQLCLRGRQANTADAVTRSSRASHWATTAKFHTSCSGAAAATAREQCRRSVQGAEMKFVVRSRFACGAQISVRSCSEAGRDVYAARLGARKIAAVALVAPFAVAALLQ